MWAKLVEIVDQSEETSHGFHILWKFHSFHSFNLLWVSSYSLIAPSVSREENFWKSELHFIWIQCQIVLPAYFQKVQEISILFMIIFSIDDIPVTPGKLRKIASSFHWKTSCAMMELIGSFVHWKCPMSSAIVVNFLESRWCSTIQYLLLKLAMVNQVIPWNLPSISSILLV